MEDEQTIAAASVEHCAAALGAPAVVLLASVSDPATMHPRAVSRGLSAALPAISGTGVVAHCIVKGEAAISVDDLGIGEAARVAYAGYAFAPVSVLGDILGLLGIARSPSDLVDIERELFCGLASVLAVAVAQARSRALAISEERKRSRLSRYFSPQVSSHLMRSDLSEISSGVRRDVSVLFADIRRFTAYASGRDPAEVFEFLNAYFARVIEPIFQHGGMIDKLLGDGVLAVFGAPLSSDDHADAAVASARAICEATATIERSDGELLRVGIGVHSGPVILGDVGGPGFKDFTVLGQTVNVASRIEDLTKTLGGSVLISGSTHALLTDTTGLEPLGPVELRGADSAVSLYRASSDQ